MVRKRDELPQNGEFIKENTVYFSNYSGTPIFEYHTDFIGLILKTKKFEYLILKFDGLVKSPLDTKYSQI